MMIGFLLVAAIQLSGVEGVDLRSRAFFDANNVKTGDPLILTIDFIGDADFNELHPPALRRVVNGRDWKVDDASAKTDTFRDARRLTYRVRPVREGVLWFPSLEFSYAGRDGSARIVRSNEIPVHVKRGDQMSMRELDDESDEPELTLALRGTDVVPTAIAGDADRLFAWRKACANPSADAFAEFDFVEARLNEAACAIRDGNWARAMGVYRRLEWIIGQTPEIERGIVAALALRFDNPRAELPVWRQVLRPILRFGWKGRLTLVLCGLAVAALVFWLLGRGIRVVAALALIAAFTRPVEAAVDPFEQIRGQMQRMQEQMSQRMQQMQQSFGNFSFSFGGSGTPAREDVTVSARVQPDRRDLRVGEPFDFIVSLEYPKTASVGQIALKPTERFGLSVVGATRNLPDGASANISNVVRRLAVPVRYDVPFRGQLAFVVEGVVSGREIRNGGRFSFSFSNSFRSETESVEIEIKPLDTAGQPEDFSGIISEGLRIVELCDLIRVETNDVVTITYSLHPNGYVAPDYLPPGAAFEWQRQADPTGRLRQIDYKRFFVADGAPKTPEVSISYYDPRDRQYKRATALGTSLEYGSAEDK